MVRRGVPRISEIRYSHTVPRNSLTGRSRSTEDDDDGAGGDFVENVMHVVRSIPEKTVMTYGEVAATLGSGGARAVGQVMARYGSGLPWWRVVRAGGLPPKGHEEKALTHYRAEGTPLVTSPSGYRVDMKRRHVPGVPSS